MRYPAFRDSRQIARDLTAALPSSCLCNLNAVVAKEIGEAVPSILELETLSRIQPQRLRRSCQYR